MADSASSDAAPFTLVLNLPCGVDDGDANRKILLDAYVAMEAGDAGALFALLDPNVVFSEAASLPYGMRVKGIEAAKLGVAEMFKSWRHLHVEITHFAASHDLVIAYLQMTAVSLGTGETYAGPAAEIFRFSNGKIIEWHPIYWDTHRVREVCGIA